MIETTNGIHRGRAAPIPTFTFPDSGITVGLRRIPAGTQQQIAMAVEGDQEWGAAHPKPTPPLQKVETLDGPSEVPNPDAPEYQRALAEYTGALALEIGERMITLAKRQIVVEVDEGAVAQLKEDMQAIGAPFPSDADSRDIYISRICISSLFDLTTMLAYLRGNSEPTEAAITQHRAMFPGSI